MDLNKVLWLIAAFALGLTLGGIIPVWAFFIGFCVLYAVYYLAAVLANLIAPLYPKEEEPEDRRPIGFQTNLMDLEDK